MRKNLRLAGSAAAVLLSGAQAAARAAAIAPLDTGGDGNAPTTTFVLAPACASDLGVRQLSIPFR